MKLFKTLINPILAYGSEVWSVFLMKGMDTKFNQLCDKSITEIIHTKFCKFMLGVHRKSTNAAVIAELGSFPVLIEQICGAVKYWLKIQNGNQDSMVFKCLMENYMLCNNENKCWVMYIKDILNYAGMQETW